MSSSFASVVKNSAVRRQPESIRSSHGTVTFYLPSYHSSQITELLASSSFCGLILHICDDKCLSSPVMSQRLLSRASAQIASGSSWTAVEVALFYDSGDGEGGELDKHHHPDVREKRSLSPNSLITVSAPSRSDAGSVLRVSIVLDGCVWFDQMDVAERRVEHISALARRRLLHISSLLGRHESSQGRFVRLRSLKVGKLFPPRPQSPTRSTRRDSIDSLSSDGAASITSDVSASSSSSSTSSSSRSPATSLPYGFVDVVESLSTGVVYLVLQIVSEPSQSHAGAGAAGGTEAEQLVQWGRDVDISALLQSWQVYVPEAARKRLLECLEAHAALARRRSVSPATGIALTDVVSDADRTTSTCMPISAITPMLLPPPLPQSTTAQQQQQQHQQQQEEEDDNVGMQLGALAGWVMTEADMDGVELVYWDPGQAFPVWHSEELVFQHGRIVGIGVPSTSVARRISTSELGARIASVRQDVIEKNPAASEDELAELFTARLDKATIDVYSDQLTPRFASRLTVPFGCEDLLMLDGVILMWARPGDWTRLADAFNESVDELLVVASMHIACLPLPVPLASMFMMPAAQQPAYVVRPAAPRLPIPATRYSNAPARSWAEWHRAEFPPSPSFLCDEKPASTVYLCPMASRMRIWWCLPMRVRVPDLWPRAARYFTVRWSWFLVDTGAPTSMMWREHLTTLSQATSKPSFASTSTTTSASTSDASSRSMSREQLMQLDPQHLRKPRVYFGDDEHFSSWSIEMRPTHAAEEHFHMLQIVGLDVLSHYIITLDLNTQSVLREERHPDAKLSNLQKRREEVEKLAADQRDERRQIVQGIEAKHL